MSSLAPARPRAGLLSRYHCSRNGHHWERQILHSGAEARWVCATCGTQGDEIPVITPEQEVVEMSEASDTPTPVDEPAAAEPELESAEPADEPEVVSADSGGEEERSSRLSPRLKLAAISAASAAVITGVLVGLKRRRG